MHVDLDAFFAAVEQRDKPSLRGKPVVVGGLGNRGVVATASYEARAFGVHSAMSTAEAHRKCPQAAFLGGRFDTYAYDSSCVMSVLRTISPIVEPLSLDEAYVDLGPLELDHSDLPAFASDVLASISRATGGLTASMGIARSKLLAKIGSEINKPHGFFVVKPGTELAVLDPLPVRALPGIGPAAEAKLQHVGVTHVKHARGFERTELQALLGESAGAMLWNTIRAIDSRSVDPHRARKSIGIEDTFPRDIRDPSQLETELRRLVEQLVARMAHRGTSGRTVSVKLRDSQFQTNTKSITLEAATHSHSVLISTAQRLLHAFAPHDPVRLLGVSISGLSPWIQGDLFDNDDVATPDEQREPDAPGVELESKLHRWTTGMDVHHEQFGDGWVWGSGMDRVTVRFETRLTPPGPVHTFTSDDPLLSVGHSDTFDS